MKLGQYRLTIWWVACRMMENVCTQDDREEEFV